MAITTIHGRQLRIGTISQDRIDATFQAFLDTLASVDYVNDLVGALGSAFNYVGVLAGGADSASAFNLDSLAEEGKNTGDYYKVSTSGWFVRGDAGGTPFYANSNDGIVWNGAGDVDVIDNTNSTVAGTNNFVTVTGTTDTGYTVDIATEFKNRVAALETAVGTVANLTTTATNLTAAVNELDAEIGDISSLSTTEKGTLVGAINELQAELDAATPATNFVRDKVGGTITGVIDGSNSAFVLASEPHANTLQVFLNGVLQELTDDYTYNSGTQTITMVDVPLVGDKITVTYFAA